jgi:phage gpG-like protein
MSGTSTGIGITIGFADAALTRHLAMLAIADHEGFTAARREIGEYLIGDIQDNFDNQKLFDGSPMPQSKAAIKRAGKTLIDDHHLYDSYVYQLVQAGVQWGSIRPYAAIHHFGGETGRPGHRFNMIPRPVMGIAEKQERRIGDVLIGELRRLH